MEELKLKDALDYFIKKRDDEIDHLVYTLKLTSVYIGTAVDLSIENICKFNKTIKMIEDCTVVLSTTKNKPVV